jgi:hypothetical protein
MLRPRARGAASREFVYIAAMKLNVLSDLHLSLGGMDRPASIRIC